LAKENISENKPFLAVFQTDSSPEWPMI